MFRYLATVDPLQWANLYWYLLPDILGRGSKGLAEAKYAPLPTSSPASWTAHARKVAAGKRAGKQEEWYEQEERGEKAEQIVPQVSFAHIPQTHQ